MKPTRTLIGTGMLPVLLVLAWSPVTFEASSQTTEPGAPDYQLLSNQSMEDYDPPYTQFQGVNCQVATGWERFWYDGPEPYWMDTRVFAESHLGGGSVEKIHENTSQMILSTQPYTAGLYQQVTGLTPGLPYGFHAAVLTIYRSSAQPREDGTMIKQVGIDPTGGTDPQAQTVVWSEPGERDKRWDITRNTAAFAQAATMTVFIRVISPYEAGPWPFLNQSFLDSAILAQTATVSASSPTISREPTFTVRWDNVVPVPDGQVRCYDAQWLDEADEVWHELSTCDLKSPTIVLQEPFTGEWGHTYRFRARVWQRYPNGAHLASPYRSAGDAQTRVAWATLAGHVRDNEGHPVTGATVAVSGTAYSATSGAGGNYELDLPPLEGPQTVTVSHPHWMSPAPVYNVVFGLAETVTLAWTLRPLDDAVVNGGFEAGLDAWSPIADQGVVPEVVSDPAHTGHGALSLGGDAPVGFSVGVTQSVSLTGARKPALSFWYRPLTADPDGVLNVILTVLTPPASSALPAGPRAESTAPLDGIPASAVATTSVFTPSLAASDWQHLSLSPVPEAFFTGTMLIHFQVRNDAGDSPTTVFLDEVSLGRTSGGPYRTYLPQILR